jgi:hypothetical protein
MKTKGEQMNRKDNRLNTIIGITTLGSTIVGIAGFLAAIAAFAEGDYVAVGACLVAAALSSGLLAHAVLQ